MDLPPLLDEVQKVPTLHARQHMLKEKGFKHCTKTVRDMKVFLDKMRWPYILPWRDEQRQCLETFNSPDWRELVVQAIFGGGKTTMMLAMVQHLLLTAKVDAHEIQICAFNVCIKNEIKKKLSFMKKKVHIQTFDSIIYHLCSELEHPNLRSLDFVGKRKFVQQHLCRIEQDTNIRFVFVDEAQDLEKVSYNIFCRRFPNAQKIFVGDVFQSIQKEPRESMLWYMLRRPQQPDIKTFVMTDTPRVPQPILNEMKEALSDFYPEFKQTISQWTSSNTCGHDTAIQWHPFQTYRQVYDEMLAFIRDKGVENVMVLTFSSAVTVRGVLGDVSRVRQFLVKNDIQVNTNHKMMKDGCVFLSTANSSKGLERDHVFGFLTFPLELAFANFSDDLVVNLTTVALSRCKKSVRMYIPSFGDRFSKVLKLYTRCPSPVLTSKRPTVSTKTLTDHVFDDKRTDKRAMLETEHAMTEALRLSILSFSTRATLKSFTKKYRSVSLPLDTVRSVRVTEEDCAFSGVVFETLVLGSWKNSWPDNAAISGLFQHHDIFQSFQGHILSLRNAFVAFRNRNARFNVLPTRVQVQGACLYAELHLACFQKILWRRNSPLVDRITHHWRNIKPHLGVFRPSNERMGELKVQHNLAFPFLNGIADAVLLPPKNSNNLVEVFEIKASKSPDWQEHAFIQSILYGIALGKTLFRVHLINVFHKEAQSFVVNFGKDFFRVREMVLGDVREWNLHCFLSKNVTHHVIEKKTMNIQNAFFLDGIENKTTNDEYPQFVLVEITSPTKTYRHQIENIQEQLPRIVLDFNIQKIIVGRNLSQKFLSTLCPDLSHLFRHLSYQKDEPSWQRYLEKIGWFQHEFNPEQKKTYLTWDNPQSTFMVQWAHLCCLYNFSN